MQRMRRIAEAPMPQGVRNEQVAEFVVDIRQGNAMMGQQQQPERDRQDGEQHHAPHGLLRQLPAIRLDPRTPEHRQKREHQRQVKLEKIGGSEPEGIVQRQKGLKEVGHYTGKRVL